MKLQCPGCNARYNLDISKLPSVPEKRIKITCPRCKHKFPLVLNEETKTDENQKNQDILIPCPDCGHVSISSPKCLGCGKVFTKEELAKLQISIGG